MDLVGDRIKAVRASMSMTLEAFAKFIGVSKGTLIHYEKNETKPDVAIAGNIIEKCKVDAQWLITGKGKMSGNENKKNKEPTRDELLKKLFPGVTIDHTFKEIIEILSDPGVGAIMIHEFKIAYLMAPAKYPNFPKIKIGVPTTTGG